MSSAHNVRIGIASFDLERPKGGLGRALQEMQRALEAGGMSVSLFTPQTHSLWFASHHVLFSMVANIFLRAWAARERLDLLLFPVGPGGLFLLRRPRCPCIAICYHTYLQQAQSVPGQRWKNVLVPLEVRTLCTADRVLCYSADTRNVLLRDYGLPPERVLLLPQIVDLSPWVPHLPVEHERGLCVCVARLDVRKGIDLLIHTWPLVVARVPDARLVIVGDGVLRRCVQRFADRFPHQVRWVRIAPSHELRALLQRADIALCPSFLEGFGLACAEAMAAGAAVVACDVDGLRALIRHGETGLLVPPWEPRAFADALITLLLSRSLRERIASAGQRSVVDRFELRCAAKALQEVVAQVCSGGLPLCSPESSSSLSSRSTLSPSFSSMSPSATTPASIATSS